MSEEVELEDEEHVSYLVSAPRVKAKPSDLLKERLTLTRRISLEIPSIEQLMKHADRFGTDQVVITAAELGYGLETLVRLTDHCDRVDAIAYRETHRYGKTKKLKSSEDRCKLLLGIEDEEEPDRIDQ